MPSANKVVVVLLLLSLSVCYVLSYVPSNHCEWEEDGVEEEQPETALPRVAVAVEADQPIVAFQDSWNQDDHKGVESPLIMTIKQKASNGGQLHAFLQGWPDDVEVASPQI